MRQAILRQERLHPFFQSFMPIKLIDETTPTVLTVTRIDPLQSATISLSYGLFGIRPGNVATTTLQNLQDLLLSHIISCDRYRVKDSEA